MLLDSEEMEPEDSAATGLTVAEAAAYTGVSEGVIRRRIRKGLLPTISGPGQQIRVARAALDEAQSSGILPPRRRPRSRRWRRWLRNSLVIAIISAVIAVIVNLTLPPLSSYIWGHARTIWTDEPRSIIDRPGPDISWIRFVFDPNHPDHDKRGLRLDLCTHHLYYWIESWQIYPPQKPVQLWPSAGTPVPAFRALAGSHCDAERPGQTVDPPKYPVDRLAPGDVIEVAVAVGDDPNGPPVATYRYRFTMGEHDISGGRMSGTPAATPSWPEGGSTPRSGTPSPMAGGEGNTWEPSLGT